MSIRVSDHRATRTPDEIEATRDQRFARAIVVAVGFYPLLWATAFAGLFMPIITLLSAGYLIRSRIPRIALLPISVGGLVLLSVPVGVIAFGVDVSRIFSAGYNASIWLVVAAIITAAMRINFRRQLATAFIIVILIQAVLVIIALQIYPARLPIPLLSGIAERLPGAFGQLGRNDMVNSSWLGRTVMRTSGIMGQAMPAGAITALGALVVFTLRQHSWIVRITVGLAALPVVYFSLSRATYGLIAIAILVAIVIIVRRHNIVLSHGILTVVTILFVAVIVRWKDSIIRIVNEVDELRGGSSTSRDAVYSRTIELIFEHPFPALGYGIKPQEDGLVASVATHSTYLGLAFRGGVFATVLYIALLGVLLNRALAKMDVVAAVVVVFIAGWTFFADLDTGHLLPIMLSFAVTPPAKRMASAEDLE